MVSTTKKKVPEKREVPNNNKEKGLANLMRQSLSNRLIDRIFSQNFQ